MNPPKLPIHEWCIILLFCSILLALAGYALFGRQKIGTIPKEKKEESVANTPSSAPAALSLTKKTATIHVKISGQVAKPGKYELSSTGQLKEILLQAQPLETADLSHLNWRRKLRDGQTIQIPKRCMMTIHIEGAAQKCGPLKILSGTRVCELIPTLELLPEADIRSLNKKKQFLREGEVLHIPFKTAHKKETKNEI